MIEVIIWIILTLIFIALMITKVYGLWSFFSKLNKPISKHIRDWELSHMGKSRFNYNKEIEKLTYAYIQVGKKSKGTLTKCILFLEIKPETYDLPQKIIDNLFKTMISVFALMAGGWLTMSSTLFEDRNELLKYYIPVIHSWTKIFGIASVLFIMWLIDYGIDSLKIIKRNLHAKIVKHVLDDYDNIISSADTYLSHSVSSNLSPFPPRSARHRRINNRSKTL